MDEKEALEVLLLDILSDPEFEARLRLSRLYKLSDPQTPEGKKLHKQIEQMRRQDIREANRTLFG